MGTSKVKLSPEHSIIVKGLAKELETSESDVVSCLLEMGATLLISARKHKEAGGLETMIPEIEKKIHENHILLRFSQLLEQWWSAGGN